MLALFCAVLIVVWAIVFVAAFCPLRALIRRRREAELKAGLSENHDPLCLHKNPKGR